MYFSFYNGSTAKEKWHLEDSVNELPELMPRFWKWKSQTGIYDGYGRKEQGNGRKRRRRERKKGDKEERLREKKWGRNVLMEYG